MSNLNEITLALSRKYTDETIVGGGAIKGKNATVKNITHDDVGKKSAVTFAWYLDDGTAKEDTMNVPDGKDGVSVVAVEDVSTAEKSQVVFVFSDGTRSEPVDFPLVKGDKGDDGFSPIVTVVTDTSTEYVLRITTIDGSFLTPNLRGGGSGGEDPRISNEDIASWDNKSRCYIDNNKLIISE